MNILLEGTKAGSTQTHTNVGRETTTYRTPQDKEKIGNSGFALDISGTVMDNSAYTGHGRTTEEVMLEAGQQDITARRNYMAVMSNSMSDEDFAKLQKEGFHPGSTDIETVVTIVDHIKTALIKGGNQVVGYTDTVNDDVLKTITGSEVFARELKKQFAETDIPLTEENVTAVTDAWNMLTEAGSMTEGSEKYMIENNLSFSPENIYTSKFSASHESSRQGKGYYTAGGVAGYYAKKPEEIDFEGLKSQMESVIEDAGYEVNEENLTEAKWLIEKGIPLNVDTFSLLNDIRKQKFPITYQDFVSAATSAIADGIVPAKADLTKKQTYFEEAAELIEKINRIEDRATDIILARDIPLTMKNLLAVQDKMNHSSDKDSKTVQEPENVHGRRLLEEVRLSMTVEANLKLLKRGYQIETAPLEDLVSKLKEAESIYAKALTGQVDAEKAQEKASLYQETLTVVQGIASSPAAILTQVSYEDTLKNVYSYGVSRSLIYEKAGQTYETLMTAPRKDMGDSIQKAFRNVDAILENMGMTLSETNRRGVRILGYNNIEITEENLAEIKDKDNLLTGVIREMKPARVLNMIREGVNPLNMTLEELKQYLGNQTDTGEEMESYSRFLYKLENQKDITEEERSAYIGIYRLVRQIEKGDAAAVGAIWQSGAEFTLSNLLSAVRSSKRGHMDYSVDDRFGGVSSKDGGMERITEQIAKAFAAGAVPDQRDLKEILEEAGSEEAGEKFDRMLFDQARSAMKSEDMVYRYLENYDQTATADNLLTAGMLLKTPETIWRNLRNIREKEKANYNVQASEGKDNELEKAGAEIVGALDGREETQTAYESFKETLQNFLKDMTFETVQTSVDVKAMSMLYKQITFMGSMAKEENYEIPANINGSLTSINLKIIHGDQQESKVAISFEAEKLGRTAAEFKLEDQGLTGFCISSSNQWTQLLKENKELFEKKLEEEQVPMGEIYFAAGEKLDLTEFSLKESDNRQTLGNSGMLYRAARAFIGYVQETGIKKGNTAYED
ncbi:MAG: DUF6240 domain-containing protein [Suilimivivens sp.]